jgi:glycosyltransferase involved in cell wall biosynthesis
VVFHVLFTAAGMMGAFASFIGVLSGMVMSFTMSNVLTFRKPKPTTEIQPTAAQLAAVKLFVQGENGIAVFLPAYKEAGNLPKVIEEATAYLQGMGCSYKVIIVNDGSPDNTGTVAEKLADEHTSVEVVHHEHNLGYGGALKTGFRHAIEKTSHGLLAFWDSDGQFRPESLGALLHSMATEEADLSIGYRIKRADSLKRLIMGRGWHWLSSHVLGYEAIDVDCGFKAFRANTIRSLLGELTGENAAISPELIARAQRKGYIMTQVGVNHYPRDEGEQTGSNLGVVFHSLKQLFSLRKALKNTPEGVTTDVNNNVAIAK